MINKINGRLVFNVIGFYICWWITIFSVSRNIFYLGPISVVLFLFIHFYKVLNHKQEDIFLIICLFLGLIIESILLNFNIVLHKGLLSQYNIAPVWAVSLWVCFGATIYHSFNWMSKQYFVSAVLGALSAPVVYFSFKSLGIIEFGMSDLAVGLLVSFVWCVFIPLFIFIADRRLGLW